MQKRQALEEIKPRKSLTASPSPSGSHSGDDIDHTSPATSHLPSRCMEAARFTGFFWDTFVKNPPSRLAVRKPSNWLYYVFQIPSPQESLRESLLAVSVARYAAVMKDSVILRQGRLLYGRSLKLLQQALSDPTLAIHDDTLATAAMMVVYEVRSKPKSLASLAECSA